MTRGNDREWQEGKEGEGGEGMTGQVKEFGTDKWNETKTPGTRCPGTEGGARGRRGGRLNSIRATTANFRGLSTSETSPMMYQRVKSSILASPLAVSQTSSFSKEKVSSDRVEGKVVTIESTLQGYQEIAAIKKHLRDKKGRNYSNKEAKRQHRMQQ
ncbi:hypothetical protein WN48_01970 [Eufriesea mexicana]|nr:hypothetical protein WN48_01970 [Eufriesea mexicana]